MRRLSSLMTLILVASVLLIGGVSAAWIYATGNPTGDDTNVNVGMSWGEEYKIDFINNEKSLLKDGVEIKGNSLYPYTIRQTDGTMISDIQYAADEAVRQKNAADGREYTFRCWTNAASIQVDEIPVGNTSDIELYPAFYDIFTAIFVKRDGTPVVWYSFTSDSSTWDEIQNGAPTPESPDDFTFSHWEVRIFDADGNVAKSFELSKLTESFNADPDLITDISIYPIYTYDTYKGSVALKPVVNAITGEVVEWEVSGYTDGKGALDAEIPSEFAGLPITSIAGNSLASYDDLHSVLIPKTVAYIGSTAFADGKVIKPYPWGGTYETTGSETVTLYYAGDKESWDSMNKEEGWDNNLGDGSRVFFVDENNKVAGKDTGEYGYYEYNGSEWVYHAHAYTVAGMQDCSEGQDSHYEWYKPWIGSGNIDEGKMTDYDGTCDCGKCGATRPDKKYWD